ncbi:hypothetical protein QR680_019156 [Steinernema hermaphroditum]|uniref:EGF-like domain-containing protein n=1 Tax=Steinernema hermaphroditum TaxID=289476 RepID=A0AA39LS51_9BILA|nr:hypothetical protein QR680_019156 [Steinernema hermaphroditum]
MKLFVLISLAALLIARSQSVFFAQQNQPCNKDRNILLAEDPTGNANAFLRCNGVGVGSIGFWERKFCPSNMQFDFINQQCKLYSGATFSNLKTATQAPASSANAFNIAILNNSCAKGERCIGGTVCDLETLKCLCPYGTVAQLDTLSCVRSDQNPYSPPETPKPTPAFFGPVTNYKTGANFNHNNNAYKGGFNQGLQQSSYNYMNTNGGFQKPYVVPAPPVSSVFLPEAQPIQPVNALGEVAPGQSCRNGEKCGGGAVCTFPMQLCLCPGELEEHGGQCVVPPGHQPATTAAPIPEKVGIGALCNQFAECDYQSTCVNGRCQCVEPMVESDGRCVLKLVPKEVGPGELCDSGEICTKGSVCDPTIPVCVCPEGTDLMDGYCVKIATTQAATVPPQPTTYETFEVVNTQAPFFPPATSEETYPVLFSTAAPTFPPTLPPTLIQTTPPPATKKPNHMKLQLGGGKQSGVGVQCRLNTDCMIGAYCNGNTSPPTCQCLSTHVNVNGRCQKVIYPGQVGCEHDLQCTTAYAGTSCIDRECVCPQGSRAIEQTCVSDFVYPGSACVKHCSGDATCLRGRCQCVRPQVLFQKQCIHKENIRVPKGLNHPCRAASECPPDLLCLNGKCDCPEGFDRHNSLCVKGATVSRRVRRASPICFPEQIHCDEGRGLCYDGECRCLDGFVMVEGRCRSRTSKVGERCGDGFECDQGARCVDGLCICTTKECLDKHSVETTTPCHNCGGSFVPINGHCAAVDRCEGGSVCVGQTCSCTQGSVESYGRCRQRPGGRCSDGQSCSGNSVCELGICRCGDGKVVEGQKCVSRIVAPGKSCQSGETCANGARCRFGVCMCVTPYRIFGDRCEKPANMITTKETSATTQKHRTSTTTEAPVPSVVVRVGPGQVCIDGQVCTGGSKCSGSFCVCKEDEIIIDEHCVGNDRQALQVISKKPKAAPGQVCSEETVCTGGSVCLAKICVCPSDAPSMSDGACGLSDALEIRNRPGKSVFALCTKDSDCSLSGTTCLRNVCRCREGDTFNGHSCKKALYRTLPGGVCDPEKGLECVGEAVCVQHKCLCLPPLVFGEIECSAPNFVQRVSPGSACGPGKQCSGGSTCQEGLCKCRSDEVVDVNKKCVKQSSTVTFYAYPRGQPLPPGQVTLDEFLKNSPNDELFQQRIKEVEQRLSRPYGAVCNGNVCVCTAGYVYRNGYCELQTVDIDEPCYLSEQCPVGECVNGVCTCPGGKRCSPSRQTTVSSVGPGEDCTRGQQCCANSYCGVLSGVCECMHGNTNVMGRCQPATSPFGPQCETSGNCHKFAYCDNGYCICKAGYTFANGFCLPPAEPITNRHVQERFLGEEKKGPLGFGPFGKYPKKEEEETPNPAVFGGFVGLGGQGGMAQGQTLMSNFNGPNGRGIPEQQNTFGQNFNGLGQETDRRGLPKGQNPMPMNRLPGMGAQEANLGGLPVDGFPPNQFNPVQFSASPTPTPGQQSQFGPNVGPFPSVFSPARPFPSPEVTPLPTLPQQPVPPFYLRFNQLPPFAATHGAKTSADLSLALPGEFCGAGRVCIGSSRCQASYCRCPEGTFVENDVCVGGAEHRRHKSIRRYARPLENCQNFELCTDHSECADVEPIGHFCRCKKGFVYFRGRCTVARETVEVVRLGAKCSEAHICADGAECLRGKCSCPQSYQELASYCLVLSQPGELCGEGQICRGGSVCGDTVRACICPSGTEMKQGSCEPMFKTQKVQALPGEECNLATVCLEGSYCSVKGYCSCNQQSMELERRCVPLELIRLPGEACQLSDSCTKGSSCLGGYCTCPMNRVARMGSCLPALAHAEGLTIKKIDEADECKPKCPSHARCQKSVCFCNADIPPDVDDCIPTVDGHCARNEDCPENTVCLHGLCACLRPHMAVGDACIRVKLPGERCDVAVDLCDELSVCRNGTCQGPVRPGSSCVAGRECGFGAKCVEGYCVCRGRATVDGCLVQEEKKTGAEGDSCSTSQDCAMELVCVEGVCSCMGGSCSRRVLRDTTMLTAPPGGSCSEIEECSGGSVCREGWCVCPDASMVVQRGICVQSKPTTSKAVTPVQITDLDTLSATSPSPSTPSSYHRGSLSSRKAAPGTNCGPLDECVGGASCIEGQCICPAGTHASTQSGRCEPSETSVVPQTYTPKISTYSITEYSTPAPSMVPDYGNSIEEDDCAAVGLICRGGTICVDQTCQCPKDFILHNDQCVPPRPKRPFNKRRGKSWSPGVKYARPNEPCSRGETCTGGSVCIDKKTCLCPSSAPVLRENACIASDEKPLLQVRTAGPGEQCDTEVSCTDGSYCYNGLCRCQGGYISYSGRCIKLPSITGPSTTEPTTAAPTIQVGPEQPCGEGRECTGGSTCDVSTGLCQCPLGHVAMGGQCVRSQTTNSPATTSYVMAAPKPGECSDDTQCGANSNCVVGRCKCRPGYDLKDGVCALQENVEFSTSFSRPRVKGPPIRRPSGASTPPRVLSALRVATPGVGVCPPGNEPLKDDGGRLVVCNGVEPNCPPRSYCYVTGLASADYNCCKSW